MSAPEAEDLPHSSLMGLSRCPIMVSALHMTNHSGVCMHRAWTESRLQMSPQSGAQRGMGKEDGPGMCSAFCHPAGVPQGWCWVTWEHQQGEGAALGLQLCLQPVQMTCCLRVNSQHTDRHTRTLETQRDTHGRWSQTDDGNTDPAQLLWVFVS